MSENTASSELSCCGGECQSQETSSSEQWTKPVYRVQNDDQGVTVHVALPGVEKENARLTVEDRLLTITGERTDNVPEEWATHRSPVRPEGYRLRVRLHPDLDSSNINANLAKGVLSVAIARTEAAKPRAIEVN